MFLLFWMLQTCHAIGWSYKIDSLQCQARHRRFHPVSWFDATPCGAASFTGLSKRSSCKSTPLCHGTAWLPQLSPASQKFGPSSYFGKAAPQSLLLHARTNGSLNPRWDILCCSQNESSFKRPKQPFEAPQHLTYWGVFCLGSQWNPVCCRDVICNSAVISSCKVWQPLCLHHWWGMLQLEYMWQECKRMKD